MHIRFNNSSRSEDKIKSLPFIVCQTFDKHFGFILVATSLLDRKIQYHENRTFLFCLSICDVFLCFCHLPIWCPGSGVVFDCMDS